MSRTSLLTAEQALATCDARGHRTFVLQLLCTRRVFASNGSNTIRVVGHLQVNRTDVFICPPPARTAELLAKLLFLH